MKQKILLLLVMTSFITTLQAQKASKASKTTTGYAITATEKGGRNWREVRMVDVTTGETVKTIYDSKQETEALNARTGKAIVKKDQNNNKTPTTTFTTNGNVFTVTPSHSTHRKVVNLDQALEKANNINTNVNNHVRVVVIRQNIQTDKPFATNSAAMAYDKKHERLYYTPMSINQLRYIDLKSGKIYYFEDEEFGSAKYAGDGASQITRMVIASDDDGYALTNDGNNLIRFTTDKKPTITDLGALTDDAANTKYSIHSRGGYGGDMVADAAGNLLLVTANRNVFKINIESKVAAHLGSIKGLPQGFSTNGEMVEEGSKVIIASSESTVGYYRFDLNTLQAEKISSSGDVFNASDLANGNLAFNKKKYKKEEETKTEPVTEVSDAIAKKTQQEEVTLKNGISVFPNPVTNGVVRLSFSEQPAGRYQVQLLDLSGRLVTAKEVNINSAAQIEEFRFPELSVKGNYLIRVSSEVNKVNVTNK
ncbi:MAG: T9SS type A sorting domain-containing protein, partial [Chitinophagaceae bacterium]|nr:T9SS type A sorting domain-containing protein [Chitinophagaceae bacterium]